MSYVRFQNDQAIPVAVSGVVDGATSITRVGGVPCDPTKFFQFGGSFYFSVVLSVSNGALTGRARLYNATDNEFVTGADLSTSNTTPTKFTSGALTVGSAAGNLKNSEKVYEIRLENDGTLDSEQTFLGTSTIFYG